MLFLLVLVFYQFFYWLLQTDNTIAAHMFVLSIERLLHFFVLDNSSKTDFSYNFAKEASVFCQISFNMFDQRWLGVCFRRKRRTFGRTTQRVAG
jgi:hypothetical protein